MQMLKHVAAIVAVIVLSHAAQAIQIGPELAIDFFLCPTSAGFDVASGECYGEPPSYRMVEAQGSMTIWLDARRSGISPLETRLLETQLAFVFDRTHFTAPEAVLGAGLDPSDTWNCWEEPLDGDLGRAVCWYYHAGALDAQGMTISESGAELGIRLAVTNEPGLTSLAFEPWPESYYGSHQTEIFGAVWTTNDPLDDDDPFIFQIGDWRRIGPPMAAEIIPAPEPSASALGACGTALLVALARRRSRR